MSRAARRRRTWRSKKNLGEGRKIECPFVVAGDPSRSFFFSSSNQHSSPRARRHHVGQHAREHGREGLRRRRRVVRVRHLFFVFIFSQRVPSFFFAKVGKEAASQNLVEQLGASEHRKKQKKGARFLSLLPSLCSLSRVSHSAFLLAVAPDDA